MRDRNSTTGVRHRVHPAAVAGSAAGRRGDTAGLREDTAGPRPRNAAPGQGGGVVLRSGPAGRGAAAGAALVLLALGGTPGAAAGQELPDGVTEAMVEQGRALFTSDGFCYTCHGRDGSGMQGAGGDLTDGVWRHTDGSFEGLVQRIDEGVRANASSTGVPMPPGGGADLTREQLRAVAAYVWTLGRRAP